jgi:HEAT repeat protein
MTMASPVEPPDGDAPGQGAAEPAALQDVAAWVGQLARTLKTCRLYDAANPTVVRFREDLAGSLTGLIERRGSIRLDIGPRALTYLGHEVQGGRSSEENLAAVLHRDGIRLLVLEPGIEAREVESLVDQLLRVTGLSPGDEDLVTLLWDADLPHVAIETVPLEGEADGGGDEDQDEAQGAAWPKQEAGGGPSTSAAIQAGAASDATRSDDWTTSDGAADVDQAFDELETVALFEIARFQEECSGGLGEPVTVQALRILEDCFANELDENDRATLAEFIPRVLREALAVGDWQGAASARQMLRTCDPEWSDASFFQDLCGPLAITTRRVIASLDHQSQEGVNAFLALTAQFGPEMVEWLLHVLAESEQMRVRRPLARTIGELSAGHPERILPWLADHRWYVVRNAVHILGWIGGETLAGSLRAPARHGEMRVRREVVAALGQVDAGAARPILMSMVPEAEPPLFVAIVQQLALDDHGSIQEELVRLLRDESFPRRSEEERRALLVALAARGEAVLPALEAELNGGGWFSRRAEPDRTAIALCVARIGTPAARAVLERGLRSGRKPVRKACMVAGATQGIHHD